MKSGFFRRGLCSGAPPLIKNLPGPLAGGLAHPLAALGLDAIQHRRVFPPDPKKSRHPAAFAADVTDRPSLND